MQYRFHQYRKRPIHFTGVENFGSWKLKQYSISANNEYVPAGLFTAAKSSAESILPQQATGSARYGIGFMIVHEGLDGNYLLVSWWEGENMLCHHVLAAPVDDPHHFISFDHTGIIACVWELEVLYFEKKVWSEMVLNKSDSPDFDNYLAKGFTGLI